MAINFVSPFGTYPYRKTWHEVFFGTVPSIRYSTIFFLPSFCCALGTVPYKFSTSTGTVPYLSQVMRAIILHDKHLPIPTSEEYGTIPLPIGSTYALSQGRGIPISEFINHTLLPYNLNHGTFPFSGT